LRIRTRSDRTPVGECGGRRQARRLRKGEVKAVQAEQLANLRAAAGAFRAAILRCGRQALPVTLHEFPRGACGDAALLLARYLRDEGFGEFVYVLGLRSDTVGEGCCSHAWLQQGDVVVDITADQFPEVADSVVVMTDRQWYDTFRQNECHSADFDAYDPHTRSDLGNAYQRVKAHLFA
jgi:hypothetical protein